jgi:hypothetical protein
MTAQPFDFEDTPEAVEMVDVEICGTTYQFPKDSDPQEVLKAKVVELGLTSISLICDGETLTGSRHLPRTFNGHDIRIDRFVKAGN